MKKKILGTVLAVSLILAGLSACSTTTSKSTEVRTVTLQKDDLLKTVSATGTVYSSDATTVYSNVALPVDIVNVSVGDVVRQGDVLAELDPKSLKNSIAELSASANAQSAVNNANIASAQKQYDIISENLTGELNGSIAQAEQALLSAQKQLNSAEVAYDSAVNSLQNERRIERDTGNYSDDDRYKDSDSNYHSPSYMAALANRDSSYAAYESAKSAVISAEENIKIATNTAEQQLATQASSLQTAKASSASVNASWVSIENLNSQIEDCIVTAPVSGTITSVKAVEGGSGSGPLFVIQDTQDLKIITNIKEYEVGNVKIGDRVSIKSDATGDTVYEGKLSKISPTSILSANGDIANSTDAEYESEITVTSQEKGLLIGMNTRLNIIVDEKKEVFSVPFEAIATNEQGEKIIYTAKLQEDGSYTTEAVVVEQGLQSDLRIEITANALTDGLIVVKNADGISPNMKITIKQ